MLSLRVLFLSLSLILVASNNSENAWRKTISRPLFRQLGDVETGGSSKNDARWRLPVDEHIPQRVDKATSEFVKTRYVDSLKVRLSNLETKLEKIGTGLKNIEGQVTNQNPLGHTMSPQQESNLQGDDTRKVQHKSASRGMGSTNEMATELHSNVNFDDTTNNLVSLNPDVVDCADIQASKSGVYKIYPRGMPRGCDVYCDMDKAEGGWTVIQRRRDGSENFDRVWREYEAGFGSLSGEFWLGNFQIHSITSHDKYELRIDLETFEGEMVYAKYGEFQVGDASSNYFLTISDYTGNAGDSLQHHNGFQFSTRDRDNDGWPRGSCARTGGGWWYNYCFMSNLNAPYTLRKSFVWWNRKPEFTLKATEMKIRRVG